MSKITAQTKICMIIGDPVGHSLSPLMHNAAYKALGIDAQYVFVGANVEGNQVKKVVEAVRLFKIRGLTCTMPHKLKILPYLDSIDPLAQKIGAVNTVVNQQGKLRGYNTDWIGAVTALKKVTRLKDKKIAILGAGGAARAIAFGTQKEEAEIIIYNRDRRQARALADALGVEVRTLKLINRLKDADVIVNATPVGMKPLENQSLVPLDLLSKKQVVFDAVYHPHETRLLREAKKQGAKVVHGLDMLLYQGMAQFKYYTQRKAPEKVMRKVLLQSLYGQK